MHKIQKSTCIFLYSEIELNNVVPEVQIQFFFWKEIFIMSHNIFNHPR